MQRPWRSTLVRLIGKRLLQTVPVLWGVTFLTFVLMNQLPGDAAQAILGTSATKQALAELRLRLNLDQPFFVRYGHWLVGLLHGQLGTSLSSQQPVSAILAQRLPVSLELVGFGFLLSVILAIPVAVLGARRPRGVVDRLNLIASMIGLSVPNFVFAIVLIIVFAVKLHLLPAIGFTPIGEGLIPNLRSMVLPSASLAFGLFCGYTRILRADLAEQLTSEDYVVFARMKGLSQSRVLISHALRNSLVGLITVIGLNLGTLIGGTVIIEQIYGLPGIGQELFQAITNRDIPIIEAIVVVLALAVVLSNLVTDVLYSVLDPRIRYGRSVS